MITNENIQGGYDPSEIPTQEEIDRYNQNIRRQREAEIMSSCSDIGSTATGGSIQVIRQVPYSGDEEPIEQFIGRSTRNFPA
ncbi:MAG: hypothetical protein U5K77_03785 [Candidatus Saccharibacteria bacterium]|nr:hypothetical protein [Candidatus Saccharibacteria bacterium]